MRKLLLVLVCFSLSAPVLFASDPDTTYGRIRIKKRSTSSGGSRSSSSNDDDDDDLFSSCMKSCISEAFDGCVDAVFKDGGCLDALISGSGETAITYNDDQSGNRRRPKKKSPTVERNIVPCGYSASPFHFSGGIGTGGIIYSEGIANGFVLGGTTGFSYFPETSFGIRLTVDPMAAFDNIPVDMEKDVFVNDTLIGTQVFSADEGKEFILPCMANILFFPATPSRSMFLALGGGPCYKREVTWGTQELNGNVSDREITFSQWCTAIHFGIGFIMELDEIYGILEFGYTLMTNENSGRFETPGDNSRYGHMPTISFSISTP